MKLLLILNWPWCSRKFNIRQKREKIAARLSAILQSPVNSENISIPEKFDYCKKFRKINSLRKI